MISNWIFSVFVAFRTCFRPVSPRGLRTATYHQVCVRDTLFRTYLAIRNDLLLTSMDVLNYRKPISPGLFLKPFFKGFYSQSLLCINLQKRTYDKQPLNFEVRFQKSERFKIMILKNKMIYSTSGSIKIQGSG